MKMRWYDHVLISLSGIILVALGIGVILGAGGVIELPEPFAFDTWIGTGWQWMPVLFLGGLLLVVWGVWQVIRPFIRRNEPKGKYYTVRDGGNGGVHISVQALDHLVRKCLNRWSEILSAHVKITGQEDAVRIALRATLRSGVKIPELVAQVRKEIKAYVEQCSGVKVEDVQVVVEATREMRGEKGDENQPESQPSSAPQLLPFPPESSYAVQMEKPMETAPQPVSPEEPPKPQAPPVERVVHTYEPKTAPQAVEPIAPESDPDPKVYEVAADLAPEEPLPVTLSQKAFPFPGVDAETTDATHAGIEWKQEIGAEEESQDA